MSRINYTVKFEYKEYQFSINGESEILLSGLFEALGISETVTDTKNVEFTDYSLIQIERLESDWLLTSLESFETEELLTVTMTNGTVYEIKVSDPPVTGGGTLAAPYRPSSIMNGKVINRANNWQIGEFAESTNDTWEAGTSISGTSEYKGNTSANKVVSSDELVRVQKNVVPTAVENEFEVYLSVDLSQEIIIHRILEGVGLVVSNSSWNGATTKDGRTKDPGKAEEAWAGHGVTNYEGLFIEPVVGGMQWTVHIIANGKQYDLIRYTQNNTFGNGASHIKIGDTWYGAGRRVTSKGNNTLEIELEDSAYEELINAGVTLDGLSGLDIIGTQSISIESGTASIIDATGDASVNADSSAINWDIGELRIEGTPNDGNYYTNVAELLYKVTLDVTDDGFVNGKDYKVNENARLNYTDPQRNTKYVEFPIPQIKGTTYRFEFTKEFEPELASGEPIPAATFKLTGAPLGEDGISVTTGAPGTTELDNHVTATVGADGKTIIFSKLPWGQYTLTETPPDGYTAGEGNPWSMYIGYTGDGSSSYGKYLTPAKENITSAGGTYLNTEWATDGAWTIVNKRNIIEVEKQVSIDKTLDRDFDEKAVDQTIYIALWDADTNDYLMGSDGKILVKEIRIVDGQVDNSSAPVWFGVDEALPNHRYYITELVLTSSINEDSRSTLSPTPTAGYPYGDYADAEHEYVWNLTNHTFTGKDSAGKDAVFQIKTPIGHEWNYETGAYNSASGRSADLSGAKNEGRVKFDNTYTPETTIEYIVQKQWGRRTIAEDGKWGMTPLPSAQLPEGASVTITLYRSIDGGEWSSYKTITLDGEVDENGEDEAWRAVFKELPKFDTDETSPTFGKAYSYRANETAKPDEFEPFDAESDEIPMGQHGDDNLDYITHSGGIIYNIQKNTPISVRKISEKGTFLPGATFKLYRVEDSTDKLVKEFTVSEEGGFVIDAISAGNYKLEEVTAPENYDKLAAPVTFTVNYNDGVFTITGISDEVHVKLDKNDSLQLVVSNDRKKTKLTVQKIVSGLMGNKAKTFTFKIELFDYADAAPTTPLTEAGITISDNVQDNHDGTWTVTLGHKDIAEFGNIPVGTYFKVTETDAPADYKTTYTINDHNPTTDPAQGKTTITETTDTTSVVVENNRNITVPTGVHTDLIFWSLLIGACFLLLSGSLVYSRRRRW